MSVGKLPEGWINTEIGDIAEIISGGTPKSGNSSNFAPTGEGIAWLTPADLSGYKKKCIARGARDLSIDGYSSCSAKLMPAGAILFSSRAPIGYVAVASNEIATNQGFKSFVFTDDIYSDYAYYYLRNIRHLAEEKGTGTTFKEISGSSAKTLPFVIAPLAEQKIIAEKLDTLLAQVDSTKARLEKIPKILKRFRQAVLAAAMNGKLTEEWRSVNLNVPKFSEHFDHIKYFRNAELPEIPESWQWLRFDQIAEIASNLKSPLHFPNTTHIAPNHIESWTGKVFGYQTISEDGVTSAKHEFYKGQIIYSKIRPYLCKVAIASFDGLCSADMYPINSKIDTYFLFRWMLTTTFTDWASNAESRTVLPKINQKDLSEIPVPVPPLSEQHEIVRRVEQLLSYADTIEKQVNNALARVNNLTQSILAKAFRGELTAQWRAENPELISGENSAAALLEKIKAERAASTAKKATRKKS